MHALINGQIVQYLADGLIAKPGGHLILVDGTRYAFDAMDVFDYDPPSSMNNLVEITNLSYGSGKWMLGCKGLFESLSEIQIAAFAELNNRRSKAKFPPLSHTELANKSSESPRLNFPQATSREQVIVRKVNAEFFDDSYVRLWGLARLIENQTHRQSLQKDVRAAAWFDDCYTPMLLRNFGCSMAEDSDQHVVPNYFVGLAEAAKYAQVTKRTISNWKARGWLSVEQKGSKIRISRAELDKCLSKR